MIALVVGAAAAVAIPFALLRASREYAARRRAALEALIDGARNRLGRIYAAAIDQFKGKAKAGARRRKARIDALADAFCEALCEPKMCAVLCFNMAADMIKPGTRTEQAIQDQYRKHIEPALMASATEMAKLGHSMDEGLAAIRSQVFQQLAGQSGALPDVLFLDPESLSGLGITRAAARSRTIAFDSLVSGTGVVISIATIAYTVYRLAMSGVAKKLAARSSLALVIAASDGPLPVGDILALGVEGICLAIAARDFYRARVVLRRELRREIAEGLAVAHDQMCNVACEAAARLIVQAQQQDEHCFIQLKRANHV